MSENRDVGRALHDLGVAVARTVTAPPPAAVRARAMRWRLPLHVSTTRMVVGLVAAGAVVAVVVGMTTVVREYLAPPPIGWPSPSVPPSPSVSFSPPPSSFSPSPRPTLPVPVRPNVAVTDPIASVDWDGPGRLTLVLPEHPDKAATCPSGEVALESGQGPARYPVISLGSPTAPAYGDLTGDGRPEAVLWAHCLQDKQDSGDGKGQLLVVTRETDGTLRGVEWVGPRGALYPAFWVADGTLYADARPWHNPFDYGIGDVFAYRRQGGTFVTVDSGYRGIQAFPDRDYGAANVDLSPVAGLLACPAPDRLGLPPRDPRKPDDPDPTGVAMNNYIYDFVSPQQPDGLAHVVDLGGDGKRYLLVPFTCRTEGVPELHPVLSQGVLVLERVGDNVRAVDFVPVDPPYNMGGWGFEEGTLTVMRWLEDGSQADDEVYVWNGRYFQR